MHPLDILAQVLAGAACAIIVWRAEPALNRMGPGTPLIVRFALWLAVVGAAASIIFILLGDVPPWPSVIGALGTAALLFCERRLRYLSRPRKRTYS